MENPANNEGVRTRPAPSCPLCAQERPVLYAGLRDRIFQAPGTWSLRQCAPCGLAWLDPHPLAEDIGKLYTTYFTHAAAAAPAGGAREAFRRGALALQWGYTSGSRLLGALLLPFPGLREAAAGSVLWLRARPRGRLLDVGCGSGRWLLAMRALGWEVAGIEPDPAAAEVARGAGLEVRQGTVESVAPEPEGFDAVAGHHVIEHAPDPVAFLAAAARFLRPGGTLVMVTPNSAGLGRRRFGAAWVGWDPPRHLAVLTARSLAECARRAGLRDISVRSTARAARLAWEQSAAIARGRPVLDARPGLRARLFQALERWTIPLVPQAGEELVLRAGRP